MMLALRATASDSGTWWDRVIASVVRWRLASAWCHGGIVIGDVLYQCNPEHGLHATTDWTPSKWDLIYLGDSRDAAALALFAQRAGAPYDWPGILGFALPWVRGDLLALYCFEWCGLAMGAPAERWMTPERLLAHIVVSPA